MRVVSLIFILVSIFATRSPANETCTLLASWKTLKETAPTDGDTIERWSHFEQQSYDALSGIAGEIYKLYTKKRWSASEADAFSSCRLEKVARDTINYELQEIFWTKSLEALASSGGKKADLAERVRKGDFEIFRLFGHLRKDTKLGNTAEFHRGNRSIFMDFTLIPATEWLLIFVHEISHATDNRLREAVKVYGDLELTKRVVEIASQKKSSSSLSQTDSEVLDRWLTAALDRGLLAEARAWSQTFEIYEEGLKDGTFSTIEWAEDILAQRTSGEPLPLFIFRYLDPRFTAPTKAPFHKELVATELKKIRKEYRTGKRSFY